MHLRRNAAALAALLPLAFVGGAMATGEVDLQGGAAENHTATHVALTGGPTTVKRVVTDTTPKTTSSTSYINVPNGTGAVSIPAGGSALIGARHSAESRCVEPDTTGEGNWCELRVLIGGVEGFPQNSLHPPHQLAFDSTNNGREGPVSWEAHGTESHRCVRNTTSKLLIVPVVVQWRVTNTAADADLPEFWLDDQTLVVERSDRC